ncbi:UNVERIFIED_CONTAM: hypothetical protein PYX00_009740 [Menopon gallinae]|uniref:Uncharacterized protein n=1 Tax=Menopon gallinae TaxID=328185 RepID=A0AAW2HC93_9NEOP
MPGRRRGSDERGKREQQKWMKDDAKASLIACSSSRNIAELVLTCKHANEIWTKLLERFERSNVQRLNSLIEKFFKMERDTSEDFREGRKRDNDEFENFYVHKPKPNGTETGSGNGTRIISNETDNTNSTGSESEESKSDDNGNACEESSEEEVQEEPGRPKTIRTGKPGRPRKEYVRKGNSFSLYSERILYSSKIQDRVT